MSHEHEQFVEGCFACKLGSLQFSPAATPTRRKDVGKPREPKNSWERGIAKDERGVPYLDARLQEIPIKKWGESERRKHETARKAPPPGVNR